MRHTTKSISALGTALVMLTAACGSGSSDTGAVEAIPPSPAPAAPAECVTPEPVSLQLQWHAQAQFAGYYAAQDQGFYEDQCLDVTIVEGAGDIVPQDRLINGEVDFALSWVTKALASREGGANIVNVAQFFQRSATMQVSFKDAGITSTNLFRDQRIGSWGFGNEYEVFAALANSGLSASEDVEIVGQSFDMEQLLNGEIDAAQATTYNEYALLLETINPETGELYTEDDFNVVLYEDTGVSLLQDGMWADADRLANDAAYRDQTVRFLAASMQGWAHCRDNPADCRDITLDQNVELGASHQLWQINEVNKLMWPAVNGIGKMDDRAYTQTVDFSLRIPNLDNVKVLSEPPSADAYTDDFVTAAWALLAGEGVDLNGTDFTPIDVDLNEGGA